jgi:hypothetical protein
LFNTQLPTKNVKHSFKIKCERIAATTTETEPMGVTRIATVKALGLALGRVRPSSLGDKVEDLVRQHSPRALSLSSTLRLTSPTIIMIIPVHHSQLLRYP